MFLQYVYIQAPEGLFSHCVTLIFHFCGCDFLTSGCANGLDMVLRNATVLCYDHGHAYVMWCICFYTSKIVVPACAAAVTADVAHASVVPACAGERRRWRCGGDDCIGQTFSSARTRTDEMGRSVAVALTPSIPKYKHSVCDVEDASYSF